MGLREGYQMTEVGLLPRDWKVLPLGQTLEKIMGGGTPSRVNPRFWGGGIPWVTVKDFATFNAKETQEYITKDGLKKSAANLIPKRTLIIATRMGLGKAVVYQVDVAINQDLKALFPRQFLLRDYLYCWFENNSTAIEKIGSGSTVKGISLLQLKSLPLPLPTLEEQTAIATALSDMDVLIAQTEKLIAKKKAIKQGVMQRLLSPLDAEGKVKVGWIEKKIGTFAPLQRGFDLPNRELRNGTYPVVYSNGILNFHSRYQVKGPGIVTGRSGTIGKVNYVASDFWPHNTTLWVTAFNDCFPHFVYYLFSQLKFERFATGSGVPTLNRNDIQDFAVTIPSDVNEQILIAEIISDLEKDIYGYQEKLSKYNLVKQGMMQSLLTGKIRIHQLAHEPATSI